MIKEILQKILDKKRMAFFVLMPLYDIYYI